MSYRTEAAARRAGEAVARGIKKRGKMRLDGVALDVHEYLGWYWTLRHRHFGIYESGAGDGMLHVLMNPDGRGSGHGSWTGGERSKFPEDVLRATLLRAKAHVAKEQACVDEVDALLTPARKRR